MLIKISIKRKKNRMNIIGIYNKNNLKKIVYIGCMK